MNMMAWLHYVAKHEDHLQLLSYCSMSWQWKHVLSITQIWGSGMHPTVDSSSNLRNRIW